MSCCGEPGIDCHSTWRFCSLPQSTNVLPTASSVTVFQLAENQTLNLPPTTSLIATVAVGAGAAPPVAGAAGAVVGAAAVVAPAAAGWVAAAPAAGVLALAAAAGAC